LVVDRSPDRISVGKLFEVGAPTGQSPVHDHVVTLTEGHWMFET